jgi:integrase
MSRVIYVQRQLGHADISTTIGTYGHLEESYLRDAAQRAEQAVAWPESGRTAW